MKFSIVTVSFNQEKYLESTIRSVIEQDYPDIEYIVVDPGSTDGSRDIIERYRDRISKIVFKMDKGAADGLNNGLLEATGDIYAFLNSDDLLLPGAIWQVALQFQLCPETEIVMGHGRVIDSEGRLLRNSYTDKFNRRAVAYSAGVICQPSTFFRASLFKKTRGFNVQNDVCWDAELFLELLEATERALYVDGFLSAFRIHGNAITGGGKMRAAHHNYEMARFQRIVGRPWRDSDYLIWLFYMARKYMLEPRSVIQRILHGPTAGRYAASKSGK